MTWSVQIPDPLSVPAGAGSGQNRIVIGTDPSTDSGFIRVIDSDDVVRLELTTSNTTAFLLRTFFTKSPGQVMANTLDSSEILRLSSPSGVSGATQNDQSHAVLDLVGEKDNETLAGMFVFRPTAPLTDFTYVDMSDPNISLTANNIKAGTPGAFASDHPQTEEWTNPTFANNWANSGGGGNQDLKFRKDALNNLQLSGIIKNTAGAAALSRICTLPVGYRVFLEHRQIVYNITGGVINAIRFLGNGDVQMSLAVAANELLAVECRVPLDTTQ